ncbi:olfactory receptor 4B13-like [Genypterus blacodes]|uniref:olfactory receptor 4B13-like n=1 Tax=Genypterus blacodes TaxID=154954 RepID=UPI003F7726EF
MENSTQISYFTLTLYFDIGLLKYLGFMFVLVLYILIVSSNILLIVVICMNRSLHEPMYLLLCSLFANELFGSLGLFPFLMVQILSDVHTLSASLCFLQIFFGHTYACAELTNLTMMSYDRYLAICCPLHYKTHMTSCKIAMFMALAWLYPILAVAVLISLSSTLTLCGNIIDKVYCDNYSIVKLACSDTTANNIYGLAFTVFVICVIVTLILFTYMKILKVCFSGSKQTRQKAISTCTPHLVSLLNFSCGCFFEILQSRFNMNNVHNMLRIFLSLYFLICQPLFNPLLYGLNLTKIRILCKSLFFHET